MLYREIFRVLGSYLYIFSLVLFVPLLVAIYYQFIAAPEAHPQPRMSQYQL